MHAFYACGWCCLRVRITSRSYFAARNINLQACRWNLAHYTEISIFPSHEANTYCLCRCFTAELTMIF